MSLQSKLKWSYNWLENMKNAYKTGYIYTPIWLQAAIDMPPVGGPLPGEPNKKIVFPEDKLLYKIRDTHPEFWENTVVHLVDSYAVPTNYVHPSTIFLEKQIEYMKKGYSEEKAFYLVEQDYKKKEEYNLIEWRIHMQQATEMGVDENYLNEEDKKINKEFERLYEKRFQQAKGERKARIQKYLNRLKVEINENDDKDTKLKKKHQHMLLENSISITELSELGVNREDVEEFINENPSNAYYFRDIKVANWDIEEELPVYGDPQYYEFQRFVRDQIESFDNPKEFLRHMIHAPEMKGLEHYFSLARKKYEDGVSNYVDDQREKMYFSDMSDVSDSESAPKSKKFKKNKGRKTYHEEESDDETDLTKRYNHSFFKIQKDGKVVVNDGTVGTKEGTPDNNMTDQNPDQAVEDDELIPNFEKRLKASIENIEKNGVVVETEEEAKRKKPKIYHQKKRREGFERRDEKLLELGSDPKQAYLLNSEFYEEPDNSFPSDVSEEEGVRVPSVFLDPPKKKLLKLGSNYYQMDYATYLNWKRIFSRFESLRPTGSNGSETLSELFSDKQDNLSESENLAKSPNYSTSIPSLRLFPQTSSNPQIDFSDLDKSEFDFQQTNTEITTKFLKDAKKVKYMGEAKQQIETLFNIHSDELGINDQKESTLSDVINSPLFEDEVNIQLPDLSQVGFFRTTSVKHPILRGHYLLKGQYLHTLSSKLYHLSPTTLKEDEFTDNIQVVFRGTQKPTLSDKFQKSLELKKRIRQYLRELISVKRMNNLISNWLYIQETKLQPELDITPLIKQYESLESSSQGKTNEKFVPTVETDSYLDFNPIYNLWPSWISKAFEDPNSFFSRPSVELVEDIFGQNLFMNKFYNEKVDLFTEEVLLSSEKVDKSNLDPANYDPVIERLSKKALEPEDFFVDGKFSFELFDLKTGNNKEFELEEETDRTEVDTNENASSEIDFEELKREIKSEAPTEVATVEGDLSDTEVVESPKLLDLLDTSSNPNHSFLNQRFNFTNAYKLKIISYFSRADSETRFKVASFLSIASPYEVVDFFEEVIDYEDKYITYTLANKPYNEELSIFKKFKQQPVDISSKKQTSKKETEIESDNFWKDLNETAENQNQSSKAEILFYEHVVSNAYSTIKSKVEEAGLSFDNNLHKLRSDVLKTQNLEILNLIDVADKLDNILIKKKGESPKFEPTSPEELSNYFYMFPTNYESQSISSFDNLEALKEFISFSFQDLQSHQQTVNKLVCYLDSNLFSESLNREFSSLNELQLYTFLSKLLTSFPTPVLDTLHKNDSSNNRSLQI